MAEIISLSLTPEMLQQLDELQKNYNFSGRSETIRAALRLLSAENKEINKLKGIMDATLIVVHKEKDIQNIFDMMHQHQVEVKTQLHNHLENHQCLEIYLLHGEGKNIQKIIKNLKTTASLVRLIPL